MKFSLPFVSTLLLSALAFGDSGSFGPSPHELLAPFPCRTLDNCHIPADSDLAGMLAEHVRWESPRSNLLEGSIDALTTISALLKALASEDARTNPGSKFSEFYNASTDKFDAEIRSRDNLDAYRALISAQSSVVQKLSELRSRLAKLDEKIAQSQDADEKAGLLLLKRSIYFFANPQLKPEEVQYQSFLDFVGVDGGYGWAKRFPKNFRADFKSYVTIGAECTYTFRTALEPVANVVPELEQVNGRSVGGFSLLADADMFKVIFDGSAAHPNSLQVECPKTMWRLDLKNASISNVLTIERKFDRDLVWPGSGGDLNFHTRKSVMYASFYRNVYDFMRANVKA